MKHVERNRKRNMVRIGLIQMSSEHSSELNLEKAEKKVHEAARKGAQIIALPELFKTDYFPQTRNCGYFSLAEPIPGPTTELFSRFARKLKVVLVVPVFERHSKRLYYNAAVTIDADGSIPGVYRKTHVPSDPCYYEKFYFAPGNLGFQVYQTRYGKIGTLICWDQWFPEAARMAALSGAEILFYPTAIGWLREERKQARFEEMNAWETVQRAHSIANGIYVAAVNRVGREGRLTFWGSSFVAGPFGRVIARANRLREEVLIADCNLSEIRKIRQVWPFLKERRIDAYQVAYGAKIKN